MKAAKVMGVLVAMTGLAALLIVEAPRVHGQGGRGRDVRMMTGFGSEIGVSIRDAASAERGVIIDDVQPGSAAERAGLKAADVIVQFDGEAVRSMRQFARVVRETAPGHTVRVGFLRNGQRQDAEVTPSEGRGAGVFVDTDRLNAQLGDLADHLPNLDFDFDFPGMPTRSRLGVNVQELSMQLADYFGAKDGVLITSVSADSAASRAGLRAGDVITAVNGEAVHTRQDLIRRLRESGDKTEVTIGIVRDKKPSTVTAMVEPTRRVTRSGRA